MRAVDRVEGGGCVDVSRGEEEAGRRHLKYKHLLRVSMCETIFYDWNLEVSNIVQHMETRDRGPYFNRAYYIQLSQPFKY
jgi:hypothetical protein